MAGKRLDPGSAQQSKPNEFYRLPGDGRGRGQSPATGAARTGQRREKSRGIKKLILCFDGTGNKFHGDDTDSNILKIFRMLDRTADDQYHYYQRECAVHESVHII